MASNVCNPFSELIQARKHLGNFLSLVPHDCFWTVVVRFAHYLLGRCHDSTIQGSLDSLPEFKAIDLQIDSLFDDVSAVQSDFNSSGE